MTTVDALPTSNLPLDLSTTRNQEIKHCLEDYRRGRCTRKEFRRVIQKRHRQLLEQNGNGANILHELIRKGYTRVLVEDVLPLVPESVLATEKSSNIPGRRKMSLLTQAVLRKDRALAEAIVDATNRLLEASQKDVPERREEIFMGALALEDWVLALNEFPSLLELQSTKNIFSLQPSFNSVVSDETDFRLNMFPGERRILGSTEPFPQCFWQTTPPSATVPSLLSKESIFHMYSPGGHQQHHHHHHHSSLNGHLDDHCHLEHHDTSDVSGVYLAVTETSGVPVDPFVVGFPNALQYGDNSILKLCVDLWERTGKTWIFELEVVSCILEYKWRVFGKPLYKMCLTISLMLAISFSFSSAYIMPLLQSNKPTLRGLGYAWQALLCLNGLPLLIQEAIQFRTQGFTGYVSEIWNVMDLVSYVLTYAAIFMRFRLEPDPCYYLISAFAALLLWFKLTAYLRGFRETGPLVRMIWQIGVDLRYFLLVLAISIIGFGNCFFMLFQLDSQKGGDAADGVVGFSSLYHTSLMLFGAMNSNLDWGPFDSSSYAPLPSALFVLYVLFNTIILLNLLIAIMSDSYDRIQENSVAQGRYERALAILEIESMLPKGFFTDENFFPPWVQVLKPRSGELADAEPDQWSGRIKQIAKKIERSELVVLHEVAELNSKLESLEERLIEKVGLRRDETFSNLGMLMGSDSSIGREGTFSDPPPPQPNTNVLPPTSSSLTTPSYLTAQAEAEDRAEVPKQQLKRTISGTYDTRQRLVHLEQKLDRLDSKLSELIRSIQNPNLASAPSPATPAPSNHRNSTPPNML